MRQLTIISGGQTGADRAALEFAIDHDVPYSGWCPRGRLAEDGQIPDRFLLRETPSRRYTQRTEWNVRDSDATVALTVGEQLIGGTALTVRVAEQLGKPVLHVSRDLLSVAGVDPAKEAASKLLSFLDEHQVTRLNVAGPRASQEPEVANFVRDVLMQALGS